MANAASDTVFAPSDTEIWILELVPVADGVPFSTPVSLMNEAHRGLLLIRKVSTLPSGSLAAGLNQ